jgi:hypothetical protein
MALASAERRAGLRAGLSRCATFPDIALAADKAAYCCNRLAISLILRNMVNETVICTYRVRADAEAEFTHLLGRHWGTLRELGFVTDEPALVFRSEQEPPTFVEIFRWVEGGFARAHEHPAVLAIWEPMDPLLEERDGQRKWQFPHYHRVQLGA